MTGSTHLLGPERRSHSAFRERRWLLKQQAATAGFLLMAPPFAQNAYIDAKVRDYLLSADHPVGRYKAAFFTFFGYDRARWRRLRMDLEKLAREATPQLFDSGPFGQKFELRGIVQTPSGRPLRVVTIWIIRAGEKFPRFVTAYPGRPR